MFVHMDFENGLVLPTQLKFVKNLKAVPNLKKNYPSNLYINVYETIS